MDPKRWEARRKPEKLDENITKWKKKADSINEIKDKFYKTFKASSFCLPQAQSNFKREACIL